MSEEKKLSKQQEEELKKIFFEKSEKDDDGYSLSMSEMIKLAENYKKMIEEKHGK